MKYHTLLTLLITGIITSAQAASTRPAQPLANLIVNPDRIATVEVRTDYGKTEYHLDNTGQQNIAPALQEIFNRTAALKDASASFIFIPGVYYIDAPITVKMVCLKLQGSGHGGLDIHGMNLKSGTIFQFGPNTGPNGITFLPAGHSQSYPAGQKPWPYKNIKVELQGMTFAGYNNTDVDTAAGYSRFRGDSPNFRGLHWYPAPDRYQTPEKQGQRALVFPRAGGKIELLRMNSCFFTDLYVGLEMESCDVSYITDNWFGQMVYGLRIRGSAPVCMIKNNCFADLETAVVLGTVGGSGGPAKIANLNGNGFAYVSKCFEISSIQHSTINNNAVENWKLSTGAAAFGAFCHIGSSQNLVITGNSICQAIDSRARTRTIDPKPNGRAFIDIENSSRLLFANNIVNTVQTQTVVRLNNVTNSAILDNIITFAPSGSGVAQTGKCANNTYRPINPEHSAPFDTWKSD